MAVIRDLLARLRLLFRRDSLSDEIREELEFHRDARVAQYERQGLSTAAAGRAARNRIGPLAVHQERGYRIRGGAMLDSIVQDVRYGVRALRRQPGFSAVAILTLALGIGASTAIVSVIDAKLLRPLPYPDAHELVRVSLELPPREDGRPRTERPSNDDRVRWTGPVFSQSAALALASFAAIVDAPVPERTRLQEVTNEYFPMYGIVPMLGRMFTETDSAIDAPSVVILNHAFWLRAFGGDPDVIGRAVRIDGDAAIVVGVMPPGVFPRENIWRAMKFGPGRRFLGSTYARLRSDLRLEDAERLLAGMLPEAPEGEPQATGVQLQRDVDRATLTTRTTVTTLGWAVLCIAVIACVNVAGLTLARGASRHSELATRTAIGAGRGRLLRQLLTEALVLSAIGGAVGITTAWLLLDGLVANLPLVSQSWMTPVQPSLNTRVLATSGALIVATSVAFGLWPAIRLTRTSLPAAALGRANGRHGGGLTRRGGQTLVALEIALAVVLLAGAGLMLRSLDRLRAVDLGFNPDATMMMSVMPIDGSSDVVSGYFPRLLESVRAIPGVLDASVGDNLPLMPSGSTASVDSEAVQETLVDMTTVMDGFFRTMQMAITRGRPITTEDVASNRPVIVLSETAARELYPDGDALGRQVVVRIDRRSREVVGIVADARPSGPLSEADADAYLPFGGRVPNLGYSVVARVAPGAADVPARLQDAARNLGLRVVTDPVVTGAERYAEAITRPRQRTVLLSLLGGLGLLLALVGVFGVTGYAVLRRTQEIGVRMAFGARPGQVVRRMVADAAWPIAIGTVLGLGAAALTTRVIESFLFETTPTDPVTFAAVAVVLATSGLVAAWIPARRAARVDPVAALRAE
jgi:putative ABC transport system permease protein